MLTRESYINSPVEIENELLHFFNKKEPLIIFDIGACEAEDSIRYSDLFLVLAKSEVNPEVSDTIMQNYLSSYNNQFKKVWENSGFEIFRKK